jgi:hypothetical protein
LKNDPAESRNLAADPRHAETLGEMRDLLRTLCAGYDYPFGEFGPLRSENKDDR